LPLKIGPIGQNYRAAGGAGKRRGSLRDRRAVILIGLGANLPGPLGSRRATLLAALDWLGARGVRVRARSPWYDSAAWPDPGQPRYRNAVVSVETSLGPEALLALLHGAEAAFGRVRGAPNAARAIDLDLLDYDGQIRSAAPVLPHPRLSERAFVLLPLRDLAPDWRHPCTLSTVDAQLAALPPADVHRLEAG
jgi:2-amino-4-hydroxy-6-hydroxymethyldihydropteridine diphosphokinase